MFLNNQVKLVVGFITYGESTAKYLPFFLPSLMTQTYKDFKILVIDNTEEENNKNKEYIKNSYSDIKFEWAHENLGFAKAYNKMINKAIEMGAEYFLALNPDMIFEADVIEKLMAGIGRDENIGAVMPKILKWDFENNKKTDIIDSLGLKVDKYLRFYDDGQGVTDNKNLIKPREISGFTPLNTRETNLTGFTGAAVLFRIKNLKDVAFNNEFFDELMFMYKEDCDLSLRLRLAGFKIVLVPTAVAYHNRSASGAGMGILQTFLNRKNKNRQIKKWSFLNQWIILLKYRKTPLVRKNILRIYLYQLFCLFFILIFEPYLLGQFVELWKVRKEVRKRRDALRNIIPPTPFIKGEV